MATAELTPMPLRRVESNRGLQLQPSVLDAWRAQHGPEQLRQARRQGFAQAQVAGTNWNAPRRGGRRSYAGAEFGRTTADWVAISTSADAELYTSLRALRNRSRALSRDNEHAKQALRLIRNNIVGKGIGLQSEVVTSKGKLKEAINDRIEQAWARWGKARRCHTAGKLSWAGIQQQVINAVARDGEVLVRLVRQRFADSRVPLALEVIEADQLVDNFSGRAGDGGNQIRMGVEVDEWLRPVAYWLYPRHPGDIQQLGVPSSNEYRRVPADEVLHIAVWDRPNQTRGEPWMHAALVKLRHIGGTEEAEIIRARASASIMGFIETPEADLTVDDADSGSDDVVDGERVWDMSPGVYRELAPGEKFNGFNPSTANTALDPFLRYMLRSVAAGIGLSYESLSRDYSQSNYSSSRLALLDDRDNWRMLQAWLIESFHQEVFERWLDLAVLSGELNLPGYESNAEMYQAVRWMPRGWDWVDPAKEVAAAKAAVRAGFATVAEIIAAKGGDWEDVFKQRKREHELAEEYELVLDSDPAQVNDKGAEQGAAAPVQPPAQEGLATDGAAPESSEDESGADGAEGTE